LQRTSSVPLTVSLSGVDCASSSVVGVPWQLIEKLALPSLSAPAKLPKQALGPLRKVETVTTAKFEVASAIEAHPAASLAQTPI
jgi:hypothetical protein